MLLDAAIRCISEGGYSAASTVAIAQRAGLSRGALQHHFPTREALLLAVTEYVGHELESAFTPAQCNGNSIEDRVDRICGAYWRVCRSDAYTAQIQIWLGARNDPGLNEAIAPLMSRMLAAQDRLWRNTFADIDVPAARLNALRRVTLAAIRGLALRTIYSTGPVRWSRELAMLREMVTLSLRSQ